jgi:hypothetical protein
VACGGFSFAVGIVYHTDKETPADAKFRKNNIIFREYHENVLYLQRV